MLLPKHHSLRLAGNNRRKQKHKYRKRDEGPTVRRGIVVVKDIKFEGKDKDLETGHRQRMTTTLEGRHGVVSALPLCSPVIATATCSLKSDDPGDMTSHITLQ